MAGKNSVIIVAAGEGRRFGGLKQHSLLKGRPVLEWSLGAFERHDEIDEIILVLRGLSGENKNFRRFKKVSTVAEGGDKRLDSVRAGLRCLVSPPEGVVLVHDGVRPLVTKNLISGIIRAARERGAVVPVIPVSDTIKRVREGRILTTENRAELFRVQTPQGFRYDVLKEALAVNKVPEIPGADEASLVERMGRPVFVLQGEPVNIKITTPVDLHLAEVLCEDDDRLGI